jgi:hypothetical protein
MLRKLVFMIFAATLVFGSGCSKHVVVTVPPRVDLLSFDVIGMVELDSDAEGNLASFATQRLIQAMQEAQPGVRVLELGKKDEVIAALGTDKLDHTTMTQIGEKYGVDAVMIGDLSVSDVRPNVNVYNILSTMSVSAEVDASLTTRLMETARGATVWTNSTGGTKTVANASVSSSGPVRFDAEDPEKAYGKLVDALVFDATRDFRVSYVRRKQ